MNSSINETEIQKFTSHTSQWWNERGPYRLLHQINPIRLQYIQNQLIKGEMLDFHRCESLEENVVLKSLSSQPKGQDKLPFKPYHHLSILDIGCGGGIVCEPLARLGANVTGIDAVKGNIETAMQHVGDGIDYTDLALQYHCSTVEEWIEKSYKYDVVTAFEIIEHVDNPKTFLMNCLKLLKPKGLFILSTLNRTLKSYLLSIIAAEHVLRWVPRGTHDWKKFLKPSEIAQVLINQGCLLQDISGLEYILWKNEWQLCSDNNVNYFLTASL